MWPSGIPLGPVAVGYAMILARWQAVTVRAGCVGYDIVCAMWSAVTRHADVLFALDKIRC